MLSGPTRTPFRDTSMKGGGGDFRLDASLGYSRNSGFFFVGIGRTRVGEEVVCRCSREEEEEEEDVSSCDSGGWNFKVHT